MDDKELIYQILEREVENIVGVINPSFRPFSSYISNYVIQYIDPYVDAFMRGGKSLNTEAAGEFVKEEVNAKVDAFMKKFNDRKSDQNDV